jgi:multidrug efflux pump subunit AcrB
MPDDSNPHEEQPTGLSWIAIQRPISVIVGIVLVVLFGALSVVDLPIQLTPDIATPTISVSTVWPGAAPVEIETEILEPQEEVLKNVQGLTRMESSASMNSGSITLEFEVDTVIEEALVRVTNKLSQVSSYPDSVREPVVETANSAGPPLRSEQGQRGGLSHLGGGRGPSRDRPHPGRGGHLLHRWSGHRGPRAI